MTSVKTQVFPAWSIESYVIRSETLSTKRCVLVEGPSDEEIVARVLGTYHGDNWPREFNVDTAEIISSPSNRSMGNREKIEAVFRIASESLALSGLVDREYREYAGSDYQNTPAIYPNERTRLFQTYGHSIENAFLHPVVTKEILRDQFPHLVSSELFESLDHLHGSLAKACAALCLACYELDLLKVLKGVRKIDFAVFWEIEHQHSVQIHVASLESFLKRRGLDQVRSAAILEGYERLLVTLVSHSDRELEALCHGHYGTQLYWTGIAAIAHSATSHEAHLFERVARFGDTDHFRLSGISSIIRSPGLAPQQIPFLLGVCNAPIS